MIQHLNASRPPSRRGAAVSAAIAPLRRFLDDSPYARRDPRDPAIADFVFGNPHEPVLPGFVAALRHWAIPQAPDWFAYMTDEPAARAAVATGLRQRTGLPFVDDDVSLSSGAFAGLAVSLAALVDPGDEVIFLTPAWFFYSAITLAQGARPVAVPLDPQTFEPDLAAIEAALSARTRAVIINSPHNPTGRIYGSPTLAGLADLLRRASARYGRPIYLLSDEAYRRIAFDGRKVVSPAQLYPRTITIYTYGKTLLTPGQRLGYLAVPPMLPDQERAALRAALATAQMVTGWAFPNAVLQRALPELESLSIDIEHLQRKRDRLVGAARTMGYSLAVPEGTFYLLVKSPLADDEAFAARLATRGVYVLPGTVFGLPGTFRLSLTASDAMIDRALPAFAAAIEETAPVLVGRPTSPTPTTVLGASDRLVWPESPR